MRGVNLGANFFMANYIQNRPRQIVQRHSFAIVASEYNDGYVQGLIDHALAELQALVPNPIVAIHRVPGAFEIPLFVQEIAEQKEADAILALGVIIQGQTMHADLIGTAITTALLQFNLHYRIPIIHEVLLVEDEAQAQVRCLEPDFNRGTEAARAAVRMLQVLKQLKGR